MNNLSIVTIEADEQFAKKVAESAGVKLGVINRKQFADGNIWRQFGESIREKDVYVIASLNGKKPEGSALRFEELKHLLHAAQLASARRVTAVIPYFEGRQDRKDKPRTSPTAKRWANEILATGVKRIITMDLHSPQISSFFDPIPVDHLYSSAVLTPWFNKKKIPNFVVSSADIGGSKMTEKIAQFFDVDPVFVFKRRSKPNVSKPMGVAGDVKGKNVLLIDDCIDTGGTFVNAADALKKAGAKKVYGYAVHAVFSAGAIAKIQNSCLEWLAVTDTVTLPKNYSRLRVISVAKLFGEIIVAAHTGQSISNHFQENEAYK